ncbi:MAG: class I SAM-dependent methyltransferase [Bacteroidales bacterium]|nr:class I SAM-dependent methyltransferase [Bacteroidales bacterium]
MHKTIDYRDSHTAPDRGASYQKAFVDMKYRKYIWSWEKNVLKKIIKKYMANKERIKYLDFACGAGRIIGFLEEDMFESIGVDISDSMLNVALQNVKKSKFLKIDLTKKNIFDDNYFDLITAFRFFLNAQQELREEILNVLSKILKKDGCFVFNIHLNKTSIYYRVARLYRRLKGLDSEFNAVDIKEVSQMVEKAGMKIVSTFHFALLPILDEDTKVPIMFIDPFEKIVSKIPFFKHFSRYVIFVCKHKNS